MYRLIKRTSRMKSFSLRAIGNLAKDPEIATKDDTMCIRFCLVANDYTGKREDETFREIVTRLWFVAFGALGEAIAKNARKGDQLIVDAKMRCEIRTDKQGEKQSDHSFIVDGFRFGALGQIKREALKARGEAGKEAELEYSASVLHGLAHSDDGRG